MQRRFPIVESRVRRSPFFKIHKDIATATAHIRKLLAQDQKTIGSTFRSSLKSMGLLKRTDGTYGLGAKYAIPALKRSPKKNSEPYRLDDPPERRRRAIDASIEAGSVRYGSIRDAALKKKARLNVLRIYRKESHCRHCRVLTQDMRYIDSTYLQPSRASTADICCRKTRGGARIQAPRG